MKKSIRSKRSVDFDCHVVDVQRTDNLVDKSRGRDMRRRSNQSSFVGTSGGKECKKFFLLRLN